MLLKAEGITKKYGGLAAVDQVSFSVAQGEIMGLIGPNGAGKTTTFNMVSGYVKPTMGSLVFDGRPIHYLSAHEVVRLGIARTFQGTRIFRQLSVMENMLSASQYRYHPGFVGAILRTSHSKKIEEEQRQDCLATLDYFGLSGRLQSPAGDLPYAHQSLLGVAMAVVCKPKLLLLDEPLAGMNPHETIETMKLIRALRDQGTTIVIVEHDVHAVMSTCDRIIVLNYGKKLTEGSPQEVQNNPEVIQAYLGSEEDA